MPLVCPGSAWFGSRAVAGRWFREGYEPCKWSSVRILIATRTYASSKFRELSDFDTAIPKSFERFLSALLYLIEPADVAMNVVPGRLQLGSKLHRKRLVVPANYEVRNRVRINPRTPWICPRPNICDQLNTHFFVKCVGPEDQHHFACLGFLQNPLPNPPIAVRSSCDVWVGQAGDVLSRAPNYFGQLRKKVHQCVSPQGDT